MRNRLEPWDAAEYWSAASSVATHVFVDFGVEEESGSTMYLLNLTVVALPAVAEDDISPRTLLHLVQRMTCTIASKC